jgi:hypothetical protein
MSLKSFEMTMGMKMGIGGRYQGGDSEELIPK